MKRLSFAAIFALVASLLVPQVEAACPAGTTNPLQVLSGQYTYKMEGYGTIQGARINTAEAPPLESFRATRPPATHVMSELNIAPIISSFLAPLGYAGTLNTVANGIFTLTQTVSVAGKIIRQENSTAQAQVYPDCSGGALFIFSGQDGIQLDFWFFNNFNNLYVVASGPGFELTGVMSKV